MIRALVLVVLMLSTAAYAELVDRIAAVVNKDIIPLSEVQARAAPELQKLSGESDPEKRGAVKRSSR